MTTKATTSAATAGAGAASGSKRSTKAPGLPVLAHEDAWTAKELAEVTAELTSDRDRLRGEVDEAVQELSELMRDFGDGAGDDQADAGAATWEREQEMSLANNAKALLEQTEHALERIEAGQYGTCESCGNPVGKMRLQAFPRATLCMTCKQRQERR